MSKPRNPKAAAPVAPEDCGDTLERRIKAQLADAYLLGLCARREGQPELAQLCACHIFDLLDWSRRALPDFSDREMLPDPGFTHPDRLAPLRLRDFERRVEEELTEAGREDGPEPSLPHLRFS